MSQKAVVKLVRKWTAKAEHYRRESLQMWRIGMPANRLLGQAEGIETCVKDMLRR